MKIYHVAEASKKAKRWIPPNRAVRFPPLEVGESFIMYRDKCDGVVNTSQQL